MLFYIDNVRIIRFLYSSTLASNVQLFFNSTAFVFNGFDSIRDFLCGAFHLFQTIEHFLTVSPYGEKHKQDKDAPEYGCDKGGNSPNSGGEARINRNKISQL